MRSGPAAIAFILICFCSLGTLEASPDQAAPTATEVLKLLQANGTGDLGAQVGPVAAQQLSVALHRSNPAIPARADSIVLEVVVAYLKRQADHDQVIEKLIPIYTKNLSKEDIRQLTEFYRSPVGQKLVRVTPAISLESAKIGQEWIESVLPGLQAELISRLQSEKLLD
jgi:hypothetical protein